MTTNMNKWDAIADHGRVWIYTTDRKMTEDEVREISAILDKFCEHWAAHGNDLFAGHRIEYDRFIVLTVDEEKAAASGCSIDSSVAVMREIDAQFNLDLFNRTRIYIKNEDGILQTTLADARARIEEGTWTRDMLMANTTVLTKGEWERKPFIPLRESWMKRYLKKEDQIA